MALVSDGFKASVTLVDTGGNKSVLQYDLTAATNAQALTDTAAILAALDAVTEAKVERYEVREVFIEDAFAYPADASNWVKASITVNLETAGKRANITIPAPEDGIFNATTGPGHDIVKADAAVLLTYIGLFQSGGEATISDGEVVDATPSIDGRRVSARVTKTGQR